MATTSKFVKYLNTYGYEKGTYRKISKYIDTENHKKVVVALAICIGIFGAMSILRALGIHEDMALGGYLGLAFASIAFLIAEYHTHSMSPLVSTAFFYLTFILVFAYVIEVGVIRAPNERTVTICLLLCAAPSLLTDRPWRVVVVSTLATIVFIVTAYHYKAADAFLSDTINSLCSLGLGLAMGLSAQKTRIDGYVDRYAKARAAKLDGLTGILNKTSFEAEASFMIEAGMTGALLIMDADNFKDINDTYGHAKGDDVIRAIGQSIDLNRRGGDLAGRFGGDEFCVLLVGNIPPETPQNYFTRLTNTFNDQCPQDVRRADGALPSLSCGAALIRPGYTFDTAFAVADAALYEAKQSRNNVIIVR